MLSNSGHDERGKYSGGAAGDQTGNEWHLINWYNRPWDIVFHYPDEKVRKTIAELAVEAAKNNNIGYDQNQRTTFWEALKATGTYHPKDIKKKCEADCSAGVAAICKATGYILGIDALKNISPDMYTGNEKAVLKKAGFEVRTAQKYLTSDKYLYAGDILLCTGHHTAINVTDGPYIEKKTQNGQYTGTFPVLPPRGWYQQGDGITTLTNYPTQIKRVQALVNWINDGTIDVDGQYGQATTAAVKKAQKKLGVTADGEFGKDTLKAAKTYRK